MNTRLSLREIADRLQSELTAPVPPASRVRVLFDATWGAPTVAIAELAFLDVDGNPVAVAATYASSESSVLRAKESAFDGDASTYWEPVLGDLEPALAADFATGELFNSVKTVRVTYANIAPNVYESAPKDFRIQTSEDDGGTWTTVETVTDEAIWTEGEARDYAVDLFTGDDAFTLTWERIGTTFDSDFASQFAKTAPQAWVIAQRARPMDDGRRVTGRYRQHMQVEVIIRIVMQRHKQGTFDNEESITSACNAVSAALLAWTPTGADEPFVFGGQTDGPYAESVVTADLSFQTTVTFTQ